MPFAGAASAPRPRTTAPARRRAAAEQPRPPEGNACAAAPSPPFENRPTVRHARATGPQIAATEGSSHDRYHRRIRWAPRQGRGRRAQRQDAGARGALRAPYPERGSSRIHLGSGHQRLRRAGLPQAPSPRPSRKPHRRRPVGARVHRARRRRVGARPAHRPRGHRPRAAHPQQRRVQLLPGGSEDHRRASAQAAQHAGLPGPQDGRLRAARGVECRHRGGQPAGLRHAHPEAARRHAGRRGAHAGRRLPEKRRRRGRARQLRLRAGRRLPELLPRRADGAVPTSRSW